MSFLKKNLLGRAFQYSKKWGNIHYQSQRYLNLHEHHAKELMARHKVRVQRGILATTPSEAKDAAIKLRKLGARDLVIKSQILAGGRGKGTFNTGFKGGVKVCQSPEEIEKMAKEMLGNILVTNQTGPQGQKVSKVLVHEGVDFDKEYYLAFLLERAYDGPIMMGSPMGGIDIEEVAEKHPEKIKTIPIDIKEGLTKLKTKEMATFLGFKDKDAIERCTNTNGKFI